MMSESAPEPPCDTVSTTSSMKHNAGSVVEIEYSDEDDCSPTMSYSSDEPVYTVGTHVLICTDIFDVDGTHWQRKQGFGEFIDTDPPLNTVFLAGTVFHIHTPFDIHIIDRYYSNIIIFAGTVVSSDETMERFEMNVQFKYDTSVQCVDCEQVYKTITEDELNDIPSFWVWKKGKNNQSKLSKCEGVLFIGESSKPPQIFFTDNVTETSHPPRRRISSNVIHEKPTVEEPCRLRKRVV